MNGHTWEQVAWGDDVTAELRLILAVITRARRDAGLLVQCNRRHAPDAALQAEAQQFLAEVLDVAAPQAEA